MQKVHIVTDSTADIPKKLVEQYNITVVPLKVHFSEQTYLDGVTIQASEFYDKLQQSSVLPKTSQPTPMEFMNIYNSIVKDSDDVIISIHLSSALSGTFQAAYMAKQQMQDKIDVTVIDSKRASYAFGIIVVRAAELAQEGKSKEEIHKCINKLLNETEVYFIVDSLLYLQKGGRIGKASFLLGSLLNIKPILSLNEQGEVYPVDKVRGTKLALNKVLELFKNNFANRPIIAGLSHANSYEHGLEVKNFLEDNLNIVNFVLTEIGPVIGTHVGPGTIAITAFPNDIEC